MNKDKQTAKGLLEGYNVTLRDVARIFLEIAEGLDLAKDTHNNEILRQCRRVIRLGIRAKEKEEQTVSFSTALEECLRVKAHRSKYTLRDIRYYLGRLMRETPGLAERPVRAISTDECREMIDRVFSTAQQRKKARANLSGLFSVAKRRMWCDSNPVANLEAPVIKEKEILPLTYQESKKLIQTLQKEEFRDCAPAVGLMLWGGVRPYEVTRLTWKHIDLREKEIIIPATHSKTGGGRHIDIYPSLYKILVKHQQQNENETICPKQWKKKWFQLRQRAGFTHWQKDVLRHTFASFHAKKFRNLPLLQCLMGHRDSELLRTRYINLKGISTGDASKFWAMAC